MRESCLDLFLSQGGRLRIAIICCLAIYFYLILDLVFWWLGGGDTPVLIPNTEVKLACGDGTSLYRLGE